MPNPDTALQILRHQLGYELRAPTPDGSLYYSVQYVERLEALVTAAKVLIDHHARHMEDCSIHHPYKPPRGFNRRPCDCGLDAARAEFRWLQVSPGETTLQSSAGDKS